MTVFKRVDKLLSSSYVITNLPIFMHPGDTTGDTNFSTVSVNWPRVVIRNRSMHWKDGRRSSVSKSHFAGDAASFGASEATICSKRGSLRSGSQNGEKRRSPGV